MLIFIYIYVYENKSMWRFRKILCFLRAKSGAIQRKTNFSSTAVHQKYLHRKLKFMWIVNDFLNLFKSGLFAEEKERRRHAGCSYPWPSECLSNMFAYTSTSANLVTVVSFICDRGLSTYHVNQF